MISIESVLFEIEKRPIIDVGGAECSVIEKYNALICFLKELKTFEDYLDVDESAYLFFSVYRYIRISDETFRKKKQCLIVLNNNISELLFYVGYLISNYEQKNQLLI